jgi:ankyrin repeat protein
MKRTSLLWTSLLVIGSVQLLAQDAPRGTTLKLPSKAPAVADAAMHDDIATVRKLVDGRADVNVPQGDGMTALHWAADHGDTALTTLLLRAHANLRATTRIGDYTPLHVASKSGNAAVVKALLDAGGDAKAVTTSGATALHFAAAAGSPDAISALVDHGADINARENEWGQTPLIFAAEYNRPDAIRVLSKRGADVSIHTTVVNLNDDAARDQAATRKRNEILVSFEPQARRDSVVAAAKADSIKAAQQAAGGPPGRGFGGGRGAGGPTPVGPFTPEQVQRAIDSGRVVLAAPPDPKKPVTEEVDTLNGGVVGYASSVGGVGGLSALHHAARQGSVAATVALLDGGADINDASGVDHTTPLLLAAINGQFDVAMKLIERGANPNIASTSGMTPLYAVINTQWAPKSRYPQPQAVQNQKTTYFEIMEALLKAKANPNVRLAQQPWYFAFNNCGNANCGLENLEGTTPFWRAAYSLDVDAMKLLVKYGADPNIPAQRTPPPPRAGRGGRGGRGAPGDSTGRAQFAGNLARGGGRGFGPQFPLDPAVDSAAKVAPIGIGDFAIHAAAGVGYGNGFAGNSHRHAPDGWMPAMRYMVEELHMDVNARDSRGYTPLHHAAARGDNEMILYLVSKGADPKAVSRDGHTTVDMANGPVQRLRPFPETIALLEKLGAKNQHHCVSC